PRAPWGAGSDPPATRCHRIKLRRTGANRVEPTSSSRRDQTSPSHGCALAASVSNLLPLLRSQVAPEKERNRIAYLVQNHPEHRAASPFELLAGPCQGVPPGETGPGHQDDAVTENAGEGPVRMAQDRWCIQKRIIVGGSLCVKPKRQFRRSEEGLLVRNRPRARDDGEPPPAPRRRRRHVLRAHQLREIGAASGEARREA